MDEVLLQAAPRVALGKKVGALRRSGITPIHVYGRGESSLSLQADTYELIKTLGVVGRTSPLTIKVGTDEHFVMVHEVQRHPVTERLLHVDLLRISRTERVHAAVPIRFEGEPVGAREEGSSLSEDLHQLEVEALPTDVPHEIVVDLSVMATSDSSIRASEVSLPARVSLVTDPDAFVARIVHRRAATEEGEEPASASVDASGGGVATIAPADGPAGEPAEEPAGEE